MNIDEFTSKPWHSLKNAAMARAVDVPSMLNREETQFYFWIAKQLAPIKGAIVDLGCFAGGSTGYLAEGNRQGGGQAQIHAFDQFEASEKAKQRQLYPKGVPPFEGDDIFPLAKKLLAPWAPNIEFHNGRIEEARWSGGPISLLVLDASKTVETMDMISEIFFPHLIPNKSVIVQQDELHWKEPWIAVQMQKMKDYFQPLCHVPSNIVAHLCTKKIDADALLTGGVTGMSDDSMIATLSAASERLSALDIGDKIDRQIEAIRLNPGKRKAWGFHNQVPRR